MTDAAIAEIIVLRAERDRIAQMIRDNREGCAPRSIVRMTYAEYRRVDLRIAELIAEHREAA